MDTIKRALLLACLLPGGVVAASTPRTAPEPAPPRWAAEGVVQPAGRSADGRFRGGGEARLVPQSGSTDGRFVLKATQAPAGNCAPAADPIFANGFES